MTRTEVLVYMKEKYGVTPEYLWARTPNYAVFRHNDNRKWFAVIIDVTENKLGLDSNRLVDGLNLKCNPLLIGSLRSKSGIFPGYHMNKEYWITILLDSSLACDEIYKLIDLSYELTK